MFVNLFINSSSGTGIYITPTGILREIPSAGIALIIWALSGVMATLGALSFAEIGTTFPYAGEKYLYLKVFIDTDCFLFCQKCRLMLIQWLSLPWILLK